MKNKIFSKCHDITLGVYTINIPSTFKHRHDVSTKQKAIEMRQRGCTYSEILKEIRVAKSTLSLWLREVGLSKVQVQKITKKRVEAQQKGARVRHEMTVNKRNLIYDNSAAQVANLSNREVWLLATMSYWAERGKEKQYAPGRCLDISNTDPRMIRLFLYSLVYVQEIKFSNIYFEIYLHENNKHRVDEVRNYWAKELFVPVECLQVIRFKTHKVRSNRKNIGALYNGLIRVKVLASSTIVRQFEGWTQGIDQIIKEKIASVSL